MNPESITVSLAVAKQLKAAGWPQSFTGVFSAKTVESPDQILPSEPFGGSYFKWFEVPNGKPAVHSIYCNYAMIAEAPTAEEILRKLPCCKLYFDGSWQWAVVFEGQSRSERLPVNSAADAAAIAWIDLKEKTPELLLK